MHCKGYPIYVFPEMKLRGLVPNFHIHVSLTDLYIPRISPPIFLQQNRHTGPWNIEITSVARWQKFRPKSSKGPQKKKLAERICGRILADYQKVAEKGPQKILKRSSLFLAVITTYNVHQDEIKFDF